MIYFALSKGRLAEKTAKLLERCGIDVSVLQEETRKLVLETADKQFGFFLVKPADVPVYVESGVADLGVAGKDTLLEEDRDLYELLDLGFGKCKLCLAGYPARRSALTGGHLRVATKYIRTAERIFAERGEEAELIKLNGSVELAPVTGLSDVIFDVVETGATLKANGLTVLEEVITGVSARLVANKVSLKLKSAEILPLVEKMREAIG